MTHRPDGEINHAIVRGLFGVLFAVLAVLFALHLAGRVGITPEKDLLLSLASLVSHTVTGLIGYLGRGIVQRAGRPGGPDADDPGDDGAARTGPKGD